MRVGESARIGRFANARLYHLLYLPALIVSIFQIVIKSLIIHIYIGRDQMKFATKAIHSSYDCDEHNRALMPPIYQNSMFALHEIGENVPYRYSRLSNPTRQVLEDTVADLEHGAAGFAFSSGMAGIDAVWRTFLRPGDTIVAVADIYGGAYDLLVDVYQKWGVNVVFADLGNPDNLDELLKAHNVKLVCWKRRPIRFCAW